MLTVAPKLLGKFLVRRFRGKEQAFQITEVEAYDGPRDLACHGSRGITARTKVMFEAGGIWYVYLVYGLHFMLNIVTGKKGYPAAVLIRGLQNISGPGKLTSLLHINKNLNGKKAIQSNGLWIEDRGVKIKAGQIKKTPRVGVLYAGPVWSKKPYRFLFTYS